MRWIVLAVAATVLLLGAPSFAVDERNASLSKSRSVSAVALRPPVRVPANAEPDRFRPLWRDSPAGVTVASDQSTCQDLYAAIRTVTGAALVTTLRQATEYCISRLEWIGAQPEVQIAASAERNVIDVANAIPDLMGRYGGSDQAKREISNLFLYLRMAKDIHYWCRTWATCTGAEWEGVEAYPLDSASTAGQAVKRAFDSFVGHPLFVSGESEHGKALDCVATAIFEFEMGEFYLHVVTAWLTAHCCPIDWVEKRV